MIFFPLEKAFVFSLGTVSLYKDELHIENLRFSAKMIFTFFIITHANILNSDLSKTFDNVFSTIYRTFRYRLFLLTFFDYVLFVSFSFQSYPLFSNQKRKTRRFGHEILSPFIFSAQIN